MESKISQEIAKKRHRREESLEVTKLSAKKRGRPLLLGEEMDEQVKVFLKQLRENGAVVNTAIHCKNYVVRTVAA